MAIINSGNTPKVVELSKPDISVSSGGLITATVNQISSGYVKSGTVNSSKKQISLDEISDLTHITLTIKNNSLLTLNAKYGDYSTYVKSISIQPGGTSSAKIIPGVLFIESSGGLSTAQQQVKFGYSHADFSSPLITNKELFYDVSTGKFNFPYIVFYMVSSDYITIT